jgi:hypothetical protein
MADALDTINQIRERFYSADAFLSFYTNQFRLNQLKLALKSKKTSAADRLAYIKYLDAHVGDVPAKGPESGEVVFKFIGFGHESNTDPV